MYRIEQENNIWICLQLLETTLYMKRHITIDKYQETDIVPKIMISAGSTAEWMAEVKWFLGISKL